MKRREFVEKLGVGSAAAAAALASGGAHASAPDTPKARATSRQGHDHRPIKGPLATATVSFGQWRTDVPLDRYPLQAPIPPPPPGNGHLLIPHQVTIKVGGTVNFIIAGFTRSCLRSRNQAGAHQHALIRPSQGATAGFRSSRSDNRLYAGGIRARSTAARRRHASVARPGRSGAVPPKGRHLVICGVLPHFVNDQMYGWVKVVGDDDDDD